MKVLSIAMVLALITVMPGYALSVYVPREIEMRESISRHSGEEGLSQGRGEALTALISDAQDYLTYLRAPLSYPQDARDKEPDIFLVLGTPFIEVYSAFAKYWLESGKGKPIVVSGGVGRGTVGLLRDLMRLYGDRLDEQDESRFKEITASQDDATVMEQLKAKGVAEAYLMQLILEFEGIPKNMIKQEGTSTNTTENFRFSFAKVKEITREAPSHIALVTHPMLLRRAFLTEVEVLYNLGALSEGWRLSTCAVFDLNVSKMTDMTDAELYQLFTYLLGNPATPNAKGEINGISDVLGRLDDLGVEVRDDEIERYSKIAANLRQSDAYLAFIRSVENTVRPSGPKSVAISGSLSGVDIAIFKSA